MDEELNSYNEEQTDVVDQEEETGDSVETEDDGEDGAVNRQSREDNHAAKLARLKAERDAERAAKKQSEEVDRQIRESGAINPYTDKPFQSMQEFLDYGKKVSGKEEEPSKPTEAHEEGNFIRDDLIDFMEKHPEVDVEKLENDKSFRRFAGSRFGREPLADLYDDYRDLVNESSSRRKEDTRDRRSTGTGNTGGDRLSAAQRKELDAWNEAFPEMKMTANEFINR